MAPEQLAGKEVSERSDIYALGLVLYEVFTGQRAFKNNDRSTIPSTSSVRDVDPVIEHVIARCLEPDPARRPPSALAVARMLPGGDPLAEALAAGDTPSPELIANSGSTEGLRVPVAVACLAAVIVGIGMQCWIAQRRNFVNHTPMELAPEVLAAKGREIASSLGYTQRPVDRAFGWFTDQGYQRYARTRPDAARRLAQLGSNRPPVLYFWYREAPNHLVGAQGGAVDRNYPAAAQRGNLEMLLDSSGRLLQFQAWPEDGGQPEAGHDGRVASSSPVDFQKMLTAAGFDSAKMMAAEPAWVPPSAFDVRAAWTGTEGTGEVSDPVRVEAAAWQGRIVAFDRQLPWTVTLPVENYLFNTFFAVFLPLVAAAVAWRNLRLGRGDTRGATRLAGFLLVCMVTLRLLTSHHVPQSSEGFVIFTGLRDALYTPAMLWLVYVAFEPYLRRYAPNTLIGWSRVLEGRWRDPLVGANVLAGVAIGIGVGLISAVAPRPATVVVALPVDLRGSVAWLAAMVQGGISAALLLTLLWLLFRIPTRRNWLASVLMVGVTLALVAPMLGAGLPLLLGAGVGVSTFTLIIARFGVLAATIYYFTFYCITIGAAPWTTNISAWYARPAMLAIGAILALAIYGFRTTLAGRPLWRDELQREAA
jgi:serine/threonine-protein kinase